MPHWLMNVLAYGAYPALIVIAALAYRAGRRRGARDANQLWSDWTGIAADELTRREFDRELRELRRRIGRPADSWPDQSRED